MGKTYTSKLELPTLPKRIVVRSSDLDCRAAFVSDGKPNIRFNVDKDKVLLCVSLLDVTSKQYVTLSPELFSRSSGECCTYDLERNELYWPHLSVIVYATVSG